MTQPQYVSLVDLAYVKWKAVTLSHVQKNLIVLTEQKPEDHFFGLSR